MRLGAPVARAMRAGCMRVVHAAYMWSNGSNGKTRSRAPVGYHMCIGDGVVYQTRPSGEVLYCTDLWYNGFYRPYL